MFTKYWRGYPVLLQCVLLLLMIFTFLSFSTIIILMISSKSGLAPAALASIDSNSPASVIRTALWLQCIGHFFLFTVPPLLFAYLTTPHFKSYLGLRQPGRALHWLLVAGIMLGLIPVMLWGEMMLINHVNFGTAAKAQQAETQQIFNAFLTLPGTMNKLLVFLAIAVLPPLGEELLFRGILLRFAHKGMKRMWPAVVGVAVAFTLFHAAQPYGIPFIFIAGLILGLVYWATGSLWCAIWGHLLFNGLQAAAVFFSSSQKAAIAARADSSVPGWMIAGGAVLLTVCSIALYRLRTPLSPAWSDDFLPEKLQQGTEFDFKV